MPEVVRIYEHGGPQVLKHEPLELPAPGPREVLVRHTAIGLNFSDIYLRTGLYARTLPSGLGSEAAGIVEKVGRRVREFRPGQRVAYYWGSEPGAYASERIVPADMLLRLPSGVSEEQAAAALLKGLTSWYLLRQTYRVQRGEVVLVPAAAGGVGMILCQWARTLGARVIGAVGDASKAALAKRHGCHQVLVGYEDLAARVRALTRGAGVHVVYDGVGRDTFRAALDSLRPRGMMAAFGNASGAVEPIAPLELMRRGSLFLTRPTAGDYLNTPEARRSAARELFGLIRRRAIRLHVGQRYALSQAARAQQDMESRRTLGSTVLIP
ncbi:MAG TPA: quinone oxidoreductase [Steroidobacteraceae bacterium]|nr:quinone oxidoreductase [Steroidobacteraceae bacterium]